MRLQKREESDVSFGGFAASELTCGVFDKELLRFASQHKDIAELALESSEVSLTVFGISVWTDDWKLYMVGILAHFCEYSCGRPVFSSTGTVATAASTPSGTPSSSARTAVTAIRTCVCVRI